MGRSATGKKKNVIMHAWMLQQENLRAFCPYFTSFFHLARDFTKISFIIQIVTLHITHYSLQQNDTKQNMCDGVNTVLMLQT